MDRPTERNELAQESTYDGVCGDFSARLSCLGNNQVERCNPRRRRAFSVVHRGKSARSWLAPPLTIPAAAKLLAITGHPHEKSPRSPPMHRKTPEPAFHHLQTSLLSPFLSTRSASFTTRSGSAPCYCRCCRRSHRVIGCAGTPGWRPIFSSDTVVSL